MTTTPNGKPKRQPRKPAAVRNEDSPAYTNPFSDAMLAKPPRFMLLSATPEEQEAIDDAVILRAEEIACARLVRPDAASNPAVTRRLIAAALLGTEHEMFGMMVLDSQHRVIDTTELFRGTIDGASVYPREVVKEVLKRNGAAVIFYHNHPSGEPEPSMADRQITRRLVEALALVDVRVLDHIIAGGTKTVSFAERGLL